MMPAKDSQWSGKTGVVFQQQVLQPSGLEVTGDQLISADQALLSTWGGCTMECPMEKAGDQLIPVSLKATYQVLGTDFKLRFPVGVTALQSSPCRTQEHS